MLPTSKLIATGVNTHSMSLPVQDLKSLGVRWVRGDSPKASLSDLASWQSHYKDFGLFWSLPMDSTAPDVARELVKLGIVDIGVGNEPDGGWSFPSGVAWTPEQYAKFFVRVRAAVGKNARLYGPACSTWARSQAYTVACLEAGADPDCLDNHLYWSAIQDCPSILQKSARVYGRPTICGEVGFPKTAGGVPYPLGGDSVGSFLKMQKAMGNLPWCFYDGCNTNSEDMTMGLFDSVNGSWVRSRTLVGIQAVMAKVAS